VSVTWGYSADREVFPDTREQRCWFRTIGNVLSALPESAHPGAMTALAEIWNAQAHWRAINAPHRVALVRAGATTRCRSTGPAGSGAWYPHDVHRAMLVR
jgi:hypothetical protein